MTELNFIKSISLKDNNKIDFTRYPFNVSAIKYLRKMDFSSRVTFIIGENGSGKSTLLESIALSQGFNPEGGTKNFNFYTNNSHSELHRYLRVVRSTRKLEDGFFLRAESFYNLATNIDEHEQANPGILVYYGGKSLHMQSHGESFFSLMQNRFKGNGLYLLDEPESALSSQKQIAMLVLMHDLVRKGSQFIISTHSPILLSYPNALIYEIDEKLGLVDTPYEETDVFTVSKYFLSNYKKIQKSVGIL